MNGIHALKKYRPWNEQEEADLRLIRQCAAWDTGSECQRLLDRDNLAAHFSASAWVVNQERNRRLMAFHNIYQAWAWLGGHVDGESDFFAVASRELMEESGLTAFRPLSGDIFSVEVLTVCPHLRRGRYVPAHLHLNVTYLFEGDARETIRPRPDENQAVSWLTVSEAVDACTEAEMRPIYRKLEEKLLKL